MGINEQLDKLFEEWADSGVHKEEHFLRDGLVDEEAWSSSRRKILFVLKEGHDINRKIRHRDLRKLLREDWEGVPYGMWKAASAQVYLLENIDKDGFPPFDEANKPEILQQSFLNLAFMNVKKSRGKSSTDDNDLRGYMEKDRTFLFRQLEIIQPQTILFGSTYWLFGKGEAGEGFFSQVTWGNHLFGIWPSSWGKVTMIDFWHPSS